jgi:hypothetical protein
MFTWLKAKSSEDTQISQHVVRVEESNTSLNNDTAKDQSVKSRRMHLIEVQPIHVVLCGSAVVAAGAYILMFSTILAM